MNVFDLALDTGDKEWFQQLCELNKSYTVNERDFSEINTVIENAYEDYDIVTPQLAEQVFNKADTDDLEHWQGDLEWEE